MTTHPSDTLLAKSTSDRENVADAATLSGHSLRVRRAAEVLFDELREDLAQSFGLHRDALERLRRVVVLAATLHDLGKNLEQFQSMLRSRDRTPHPFRHEVLSIAQVLGSTALRPWIEAHHDQADIQIACLIVAGHHLRVGKSFRQSRHPAEVRLQLDHPSLEPLWNAIRPGAPTGFESVSWSHEQAGEELRPYTKARRTVKRRVAQGELITALGKSLLIAADTAGSALPAGNASIETWIREALSSRLDPDSLAPIIHQRLGGGTPYGFQRSVGSNGSRVTLVTAGCGNGKTLAAYLWAMNHAVRRSLVFCYPTTGTTSAGFQDYLLAQSDLERRLLHSRAGVDVESFMRCPDSPGDEGGDQPLEVWAPDVLDRWNSQVVACTVDTVLGLLTNWRTSLASIPLWARAAFVFDEVHSYDPDLFGTLLRFLEVVRAPVLLMTASLTPARIRALERATGEPLEPIRGEHEIESAERYRLEITDEDRATNRALEAVHKGEKILWICNTVRRAQRAFQRFRDLGVRTPLLLYHARFRYQDRVERQRQVLEAFDTGSGRGALVVATQVCEMSLDISADRMITECAPLPALVQRLGRLNRSARTPTEARPCHVIPVDKPAPYGTQEVEQACDRVSDLSGMPLSQFDLAREVAKLHEGPPEIRTSPWLDEVLYTQPRELRKPSWSKTIVRQEDLDDLDSIGRRDIVRLSIPMNRPPGPIAGRISPRPCKGAFVAPAGTIRYSTEQGASWAK